MPLYNFTAFDAHGRKRSGVIEAHSEREAKDKLRDQGVMVSSLSEKSSFTSKENIKGEALMTFTLQLAQLVNAGVPLYESMIAIEEQNRTEPYHRILLSLCEQIKAGTKLSDAMAAFPESFNKLYRAMITAGESVGAVDIVLEKLSHLLQRQTKLKREISTALIYPAILASFSLLVIALLLGFVVPSIEGIFAERKLNGFTQFVISVSHLFRDWWWLYIPALVAFIAFAVWKIRSPAGRLWMERNLIRIPILRTLMIQASVARFTRTMGTLQQGGLPMIDSLRIAREVMRNVVLEGEVAKAEARIVEGSSLGLELSHSPWFPPMVAKMLSVGEEAGSTVTMLNKIADMYEDDLEKTLQRVMALAQPVILIVMGIVIGTVLMAILLPLTDVSALSL